MPLISDSWTDRFTWMGIGPMPPNEREKLRNIVSTAHSNGQREQVWREWLAAQVDYINTGNLDALQSSWYGTIPPQPSATSRGTIRARKTAAGEPGKLPRTPAGPARKD